jgi:hypothetical protein
MPLSEERRRKAFAEALTPSAFVESMTRYRERLKTGYEATVFTSEQLLALNQISEPLEVLALVEETSGDVVYNLPILIKLADQTGKLKLYLLRREENQDIAGQYLLRSGRNHLPTYIFFNSTGQELGTFIERPMFVTMQMAEWLEEFRQDYSHLPAYDSLPGQMPDETRLALLDFFAEKREPLRPEETAAIIVRILELAVSAT